MRAIDLVDTIDANPRLFDTVVVSAIAAVAVLSFLGRLQGTYPQVYLSGDAALLASFAAARDHPDFFADDTLLSNLENFRYYFTLYIPTLQALTRISENYGLSVIWLQGPQVFLQVLGFYVLGVVTFRSRYWAALLALVTFVRVPLNIGEYWGFDFPVPRSLFQALLPFLLAATVVWAPRPKAWPVLLAATGALMYVHPVSTPAWALAIWLGLWIYHPADWSWPKRLTRMFLVGVVFLAVVSVFLAAYLQPRAEVMRASYQRTYEITQQVICADFLDVPAAVAEFTLIVTKLGLLPAAIAAVLILLMFRAADRRRLALVGAWAAGIALAGVALPLADQALARAFERLPQFDLLRAIRYFVPLMLLLVVWSMAEMSRQMRSARGRNAVVLAGSLFAAIWFAAHAHSSLGMTYRGLACLSQGRLICNHADGYLTNLHQALYRSDLTQMLDTIRDRTAAGSRFLTFTMDRGRSGLGLGVRYAALRPIVHHYKDRGVYTYANQAGLEPWFEINEEIAAIRTEPNAERRLAALVALSRRLGADYLMFDFPVESPAIESLSATVVARSKNFLLIRL